MSTTEKDKIIEEEIGKAKLSLGVNLLEVDFILNNLVNKVLQSQKQKTMTNKLKWMFPYAFFSGMFGGLYIYYLFNSGIYDFYNLEFNLFLITSLAILPMYFFYILYKEQRNSNFKLLLKVIGEKK